MFRLKNISLKTKLLLIYFLTIFIPLAVMSQIIISVSGEKIVSQSTEINRTAAEQTAQNIKDMLKQNLNIVNQVCLDQRLIGYLDLYSVYTGEENWIAHLNYLYPLSMYISNFVQSKLRIYYLNESLVQDNQTYIFATESEKKLNIYKLAMSKAFSPVWIFGDNSIFLGRAMNGNNYEAIAVAAVEIPEEIMYSFISKSAVIERTVIICDKDGMVISSNDRDIIGTSIRQERYFSAAVSTGEGDFEYQGIGNYKVIRCSLKENKDLPDWSIITLVPVDRIFAESHRNSMVGLVISILCLLVSTILFILFLDRIINRISCLVQKMRKVKEGCFETLVETGPQDEIGSMVANFNLMVESLQTLIYENYEAKLQIKDVKIKKREAELYALQSQINPHFLFNALESIRLGLYSSDTDRTAMAVLNLSKLLRKSLGWGGEIIPLSDEIELIRNYLEIQAYRFADRISYRINVPKELGSCKIPKLIIQTFVENAVIHGLEKKWEQGAIEVTAEAMGRCLFIYISDNGIGIEPEVLERIRLEIASEEDIKKGGSIGIKNVSDRIRLHYGEQYGIMINSEMGLGTSVTIRLPVIEAFT